MTSSIARYTVKQMAELSGVSVRTLHHYDSIGLLKPAAVGDNTYRYYGVRNCCACNKFYSTAPWGFP